MPTFIQIIPIVIAILSLIMAYVGFREKASDKAAKDLADRLKADALADSVNSKAIALAESVQARAMEIRELQKAVTELEIQFSVLDERFNGLTKMTDKIDEKLDRILENI